MALRTLKTSFAIGILAAALAGAQAALARPTDASDRAKAGVAATAPDWFERAALNALREASAGSLDAHQRARAVKTVSGSPAGHVDRYELDLPSGPVATTATGGGREIEWPQLGIGFGIGILLALGLVGALRLMRIRPPLAH